MTRRTPTQYDWAKLEFDARPLPASPARSSARTEKIQFVVVHHMTIVGKGTGTALTACINTWKTREASAHYGVDGKNVAQFVWDNMAAWATANHHGNHAGISIEHANSKAAPSWEVADDTWHTGAKLVAYLHKVYKLGRPKAGKTLFQHSDFYATSCAGPYLGKKIWGAYVAEAQRVYDEITAAKPKVTKAAVDYLVAKAPAYGRVGPGTTTAKSTGHGYEKGHPIPTVGHDETGKYVVTAGGQWFTLASLTVKPNPPIVDPPSEPVASKPHEYISANLAGYDSVGKGEKTRVARAQKDIPNYLLPKKPLWFHFQECAVDMWPELDKTLKGYTRVGVGGKGRESYHQSGKVTIIEAVLLNVKHMLKADTKEFLVIAWQDEDGFQGVYANFHNENQGTSIQKTQLRDVMSAARDMADKHGIPRANIAGTGDGNYPGARAYIKSQKWRECADIAKKTIDLVYKTTNGWKASLTKGDRIDVDFFQNDALVDEAEVLFGAVIADHWQHRIVHRLIKK